MGRVRGDEVRRGKLSALLALGVAVSLLLSVAGCGVLMPEKGSYQEAIPAALEASDIGISEALAGSSLDGFSRSVDVYITLDHDTLSASALHEVLAIVAPLIDQPGANELKLSFDLSLMESADVRAAKDELNEKWGPGVRPDNLSWFLTGSDSEVNVSISSLNLYLKDTKG